VVSKLIRTHPVEVARLPVFVLVNISPVTLPAVLEPEDHGRRIGRNMLTGLRPDDLALILEDLFAIERITGSPMEQTALNPIVSRFFPGL